MNRYSLVVLVLSLVVIGGYYFLQSSDEAEEATYAVPTTQFSIDAERVVRIDISRLTGFVRLEKVRGEWKVTEPIYGPADPGYVQELQEALSRFRLTGMVSTNPSKRHVFQVGDEGTNVAFFTDDGKSLPLIFGKAAPSAGSAFVRPPLSDTVYIARGVVPSVINRDLRDWRQRTLYETAPEAITSLNIRSGQRKVDIERREIGWVSSDRTLPVDVISPALVGLSRLRAEAFIDTPIIVRGAPRFEVQVGGPQPVKLDFYSMGNADTNFLLKTSGSPNLFVVGPSVVRSLQRVSEYLAPPSPPPAVAYVEPTPPPATQPTPVVQPPPTPTRQPQQEPKQSTAERRRTRQAAQSPPAQQQMSPPIERPARVQTEDPRSTRRAADPTPRRLEDEGELTVHTVRRGESINTIARRYEVSVDQIKKWNGLQTDVLVPGAEVYVFVKRR